MVFKVNRRITDLLLFVLFFICLACLFPAKTEAKCSQTGNLYLEICDETTGTTKKMDIPLRWNVDVSDYSWAKMTGAERFIKVTETTATVGNVKVTVGAADNSSSSGEAGILTFTKFNGSDEWSAETENNYSYIRAKVTITLPAGYYCRTAYRSGTNTDKLCRVSLNESGDKQDHFGSSSHEANNPIKTAKNSSRTITSYYLINVTYTGLRSETSSETATKYKGTSYMTCKFNKMPYNVYYQEDESTGATSNNIDGKTVSVSSALRDSGSFTKKGYTQTGWKGFSYSNNNTEKTDCTYDLGESITAPYAGDGIYRKDNYPATTGSSGTSAGVKANSLTLWPVWKAHSLSVKLDGNGASLKSGKSSSDESLSMNYGDGTKLGLSSDLYNTPEDKYALSWNTKADGTGETYTFGTDLSTVKAIEKNDDTNLTLYAIWSDTDSFTVYNPAITPPPGGDKAKMRIVKRDSATKAPLAGAEFSVSVNGGEVETLTTDSNGKLEFEVTTETSSSSIPVSITETKAPDGYVLDSTTSTINFTVTDGAITLNDFGNGSLLYSTYELNDGVVTYVFDLENKPNTKDLVIKKKDAETSSVLLGAKFTLKGVSGDAVGYIQSDQAVNAEGLVTFKGLKPGIYTLTETTAPSGYKLPNTTYTVTVTDSGITVEK